MSEKLGIWINKFIGDSGFCSRREAEKFIDSGLVTVNKTVVGKVTQVFPDDVVMVDGKLIDHRKEEDIVFIALNKPVGIVSTTELKIKNNIIDFVNHSARIFPIGRLDKDSQGLIFLTNNGNIVNKILRAGNNHEKEYVVTVNRTLTDNVIRAMSNGVPMLGEITKKCVIKKEAGTVFRIFLVQGLNRQIRRMCEHFGYEVIKLERVRIMNITLKGLPTGQWRDLTESEIKHVNKLTENSNANVEKAETTIIPKQEKPIVKQIILKPSLKNNISSSSNTIDQKENTMRPKVNKWERPDITEKGTKQKSTKPRSGNPTGKFANKEKPASSGPRIGKSKPPAKKTGSFKAFRNSKKKEG